MSPIQPLDSAENSDKHQANTLLPYEYARQFQLLVDPQNGELILAKRGSLSAANTL